MLWNDIALGISMLVIAFLAMSCDCKLQDKINEVIDALHRFDARIKALEEKE